MVAQLPPKQFAWVRFLPPVPVLGMSEGRVSVSEAVHHGIDTHHSCQGEKVFVMTYKVPVDIDTLWENLKEQCAANPDKSKVMTLVQVKKKDLVKAVLACIDK